MPTKYDVFVEIVHKAPCFVRDMAFSTQISFHINNLLKENYIKKTSSGFLPVKTNRTQALFTICKFCIDSGLNYNTILSENFLPTVKILGKNTPQLRPPSVQGNYIKQRIMLFLEKNQFILVRKLRPRVGTILPQKLWSHLAQYKNDAFDPAFSFDSNVQEAVLKFEEYVLNPFGEIYFASLVGSAQLEGSTMTLGETVQMLTQSIYPQKSHEEIQMVTNLNEAMRFVLSTYHEPLGVDHITELNKRILYSLHEGAGMLKTTENRIQGNPAFKTTPPQLVLSEISEYVRVFNSVRSRAQCLKMLGMIHNQFHRIHPFPDGNSRTTRLLVNWMLLRFSFPPIVFRVGSLDYYMSLTKLSNERDDDGLQQLFCHLLLHEHLVQKH